MLYIDWRAHLISNKNNFHDSKEQRIIRELETNPLFFPENIEKKEGTPFYNFIFKGTSLRFAELQSGIDMKEDVVCDAAAFMHVFGWNINGTKRKKEEARLYLNLMAKNIPAFLKAFYEKCRKHSCLVA